MVDEMNDRQQMKQKLYLPRQEPYEQLFQRVYGQNDIIRHIDVEGILNILVFTSMKLGL